MKAVVVIPGLVKYLPYVAIYKELFENNNVEYVILQWDRMGLYDGHDINVYRDKDNFTEFAPKRIIAYYNFIRWIKKRIYDENPDILIVATIAPALCLYPLLKKSKKKYVLDIRDYSPLVKYFRPLISNIIKWSRYTVISSKGFLKWLPQNDYLPLYNFGKILPPVRKERSDGVFKVATIGFLRDYKENTTVIDALGNRNNIELIFHGNGIVLHSLQQYTKDKGYHNVFFTGEYKKDEEPGLYEKADIVNVMMPYSTVGSSTLISNRFVNAVSYQRPMIVSKSSYQAELVEKYGLGISLGEKDNIYDSIINYLRERDNKTFTHSCESFYNDIMKEKNIAIDKLQRFILDIKNRNSKNTLYENS